MTLANKVTMFRIVLIPVLIAIAVLAFPFWSYYAAAVFIIAALSDILDGNLARKYNQISDFGKLVDPIADKMLLASAMIILVSWGKIPFYTAIVLLSRDHIINAFRIEAAKKDIVLAARKSGKIKTLLQCICYSCYLFESDTLGHIFLAAAVITTLWSLIDYIYANRIVIDKSNYLEFVFLFADKVLISALTFVFLSYYKMNIIAAMFFIGCDIFISGLLVTNASRGVISLWRLSLLFRLAAQCLAFFAIISGEKILIVVSVALAVIMTIVNSLDYLISLKKLNKLD